jgi:hypothetical protein
MMAKNFPYFKFIATEWLTGDIVYENFDVQGLFINVCALYWQRDGKLSIEDITKRYKNEDLIQSLSGRFFSVNDGFITIGFLDEQLIDANHISKTNSENGKKGAEKRKQLAMAKRTLSEQEANFSKEEKEEEKEENKNNNKIPDFQSFLNHALTKEPNIDEVDLRKKYDAWINNDWHNGNGKKITAWKRDLNSTIPYIKKKPGVIIETQEQMLKRRFAKS